MQVAQPCSFQALHGHHRALPTASFVFPPHKTTVEEHFLPLDEAKIRPPVELERAQSSPCQLVRTESSSSAETVKRQTTWSQSTTRAHLDGAGADCSAARMRDSQHCLAGVLYKNSASRQMLRQYRPRCPQMELQSSSSDDSEGEVEPEVVAATRTLESCGVDQQINAANTIANLALRAEHRLPLIERALDRILDLCITSPCTQVHRFLSLSLCRLAQASAHIDQLMQHPRFFDGVMALAKSSAGTIWRPAVRTLALVAVSSKSPEQVVAIGALPLLIKLAQSDQLEFQSDALRALERLSQGPCVAAVAAGGQWREVLSVGTKTTVPIIATFVADTLVNCVKAGTIDATGVSEVMATVEALPQGALRNAFSDLLKVLTPNQ